MKVSILMLTYNAPKYVKESILTLKENTKNIDYELIVLDNHSKFMTRRLLEKLEKKGFMDKLILSDKNLLFAKGNNVAFEAASDSEYIVLLNSDVKINSSNWLETLLKIHPKEGGISAFGAVDSEPIRADGYCLLIDKNLYEKYKLDETYEWWWGVTKLESMVLKEGKKIVAVRNHEEFIHHYGGKSGKGYKNAKGMDADRNEVKKWFDNNKVEIIDQL